ncbi:MAG TPA: asparagine synthetase B, partial [Defluviicoccus sp.]|nr:asparagine synthetase B [Defluviicoccus sp.]
MCGIVAIFAYRAAAPGVSESELLTLRDAMRPRGPDGEGLWLSADGRVGLAHRRLAILDLSDAGAQPMPLDDDPLSLIITFNGEIYNYRELRAELEAQGSRFRSTSDTEVRLHLYRRDGTAMVERLRGMYAFVMWDARQRRLFAARDPFGIKPLYYADDGQTIRLASQVKALLAGGQIDTTAEPAGHAGFFLFGHVPEPFTLYKGIRTLPAGGVLTIGDGGQPSERQ